FPIPLHCTIRFVCLPAATLSPFVLLVPCARKHQQCKLLSATSSRSSPSSRPPSPLSRPTPSPRLPSVVRPGSPSPTGDLPVHRQSLKSRYGLPACRRDTECPAP
ncbi:hypothetical protein BD414DRAFT_581544, partial [Trametes punicea]